MNKSILAASLFVSLCTVQFAQAGLQFQHVISGMTGVKANTPLDVVDAAIVAPRGMSCQLPSKDGFCTIPLVWLNNLDAEASLWRSDSNSPESILKVAQGYDGVVSAYVRYGQTLTYSLHKGAEKKGQLMDQAVLTALWDDEWAEGGPGEPGSEIKSGVLTAENEGVCQLYTSLNACELNLSWSTENVSSARVWERTSSGLKVASANLSNGSARVLAYDKSTVYELRDGSSSTGELLAAAITKGQRTSPVMGSMTFPDGKKCITTQEAGACEILVDWETNDMGRLWVREKPFTSPRANGQHYVEVGIGGGFVDLRAGTNANGPILARESLEVEVGEHSGTLKAEGGITCTAAYQKGSCSLGLTYKGSDRASIWDDRTQQRVGGGNMEGTSQVPVFNHDGTSSSENVYSLRVHGSGTPRFTNPILTKFRLYAERPLHTGSVTPVTGPSCNLLYSKTSCKIMVNVASTSPLVSLWNDQGMQLWNGASGANFEISVNEGTQQFVLREGNEVNNGVLNSVSLSAARPSYYASLSTPNGDTCTTANYSGYCALSFQVVSNTKSTLYYRETTDGVVGSWAAFASNLATGTTMPSLGRSAIIGKKTYEIEARQYSSPYEVLDRIDEVSFVPNAPHSFTMTDSGDAFSTNEPVCKTYYNSAYCSRAIHLTWVTSAPKISQCFYDSVSNTPVSSVVHTSAKTYGVGYSFYPNRGYSIAMIEGEAGCPNRDMLSSSRVMWSESFNQSENLLASATPAAFNTKSGSCAVIYAGYGSCNLDVGYTVDRFSTSHQKPPQMYVRSASGDYSDSVNTNAYEDTVRLTIAEGAADKVFELRVMAGASKSDSDPVVDRFTLTHTMAEITGSVFAARTGAYSGYSGDYYYKQPYTEAPYYFSRSILVDGKYGGETTCALNVNENVCNVYFNAMLNMTSGAASIWVDGSYHVDFTRMLHSSTSGNARVDLSIGSHLIEMREGKGQGSANNKLIDSFTINVMRPTYSGTISRTAMLPPINYLGEKEEMSFTVAANTVAYLYNKTTNELLCTKSAWYTADNPTSGTKGCKVDFGAGAHVVELRTHQDGSDPENVVLDYYEFTLVDTPQTGSVAPRSPYEHFYNTCDRTYYRLDCDIHFQYKTSFVNSDSGSVAVCLKDSDGNYSKKSNLYGKTTWSAATFNITENAGIALLVNGPACPLNEADEQNKVLAQWDVSSNQPAVALTFSANDHGGRSVVKSTTESNTWICNKRMYGEACQFSASGSYPTSYDKAGQSAMAYLAVRDEAGRYITGGNKNVFGFSTSIANSIDSQTYYILSCKSPTANDGSCPYDEQRLIDSFVIKVELPAYTGTITPQESATGCQANYGASTCTMTFDIQSDSFGAVAYRDGVSIGSVSRESKTFTVSLPAKPSGEKTTIKLYDGNTSGPLLDSIDVYAEVYNPARFAFQHASHTGSPDTLSEHCRVSGFVASEEFRNCSFSVPYESDASTKYIKVVTGNNPTTLTVSGNGTLSINETARVAPFVLNSEVDSVLYRAEVYADAALTQMMDVIEVRQRNTGFSEAILSQAGANGYYASGLSTQNQYGGYSVGYRYRLTYNTGYGIPLFTGDVSVDDISLSTPSACAQTEYGAYGGGSNVCNAIGVGRVNKSIPAGAVGTFTTSYSGARKVKRVFYKLTTNPNISDPTVTVGGIVRPLPMDDAWHYVNMNETTSGSLVFSALNGGSAAISIQVHMVAEFYTDD